MARDTSELRKELDKLTPRQKAELARTLIDSLDEYLDGDVEQLWLDEATRRYESCRRGEHVFPAGGGGIFTSSHATRAVNLRFLDF